MLTVFPRFSMSKPLSGLNYSGLIQSAMRYASSTSTEANQDKRNNKKNRKNRMKKKKKKNFYEVLGIEPGATKAEVKKAYYELARTMHPDANPDDPNAAEAFDTLSRAYHVLSDDARRTAYDASGYNEDESRAAAAAGTGADGGDDGSNIPGGLSVYEQLVRGNTDVLGLGYLKRLFTAWRPPQHSPQQSGAHRNAVTVTIPVSFAEAVTGTHKTVPALLTVRCQRCSGSGELQEGAGPMPCRKCGGSGTAAAGDITAPCKACGGSGHQPAPRCPACRGAGCSRVKMSVEVSVPQGAADGDVVQVAVPEDRNVMDAVFAQVVVKPHPLFRRSGLDLHVDVPVSIALAALGGSVRVPLLLSGSHATIRVIYASTYKHSHY